MDKRRKDQQPTRVSIHSIKNILGNQEQVSLFSEHDKEFAEEHQIELFNSINRFGIELSDTQFKVMEGILRGFSETGYKGNLSPKDKDQLIEERFYGKEPDVYKYIQEIPRLRATQSQILEWADVNKNSIASKSRALEALTDLATTQYCFYYDRLAFSEEGKPLKDKEERWIKEQVTAVDTLFTIKKIAEKNTGSVDYYEITPSVIFLDQIDGYFILIPNKWREEVRKIFGNKKASAYTFRFLLFLRYQYELKRRSSKKQDPHKLEWSPEEIAIALKMPESVYLKKKKRMNEILEDAYSVAKQLGYLSKFERRGHLDVLTFNNQKYSLHNPVNSIECAQSQNNDEIEKASEELLNFFVECRRRADPKFKIPEIDKNRLLYPFKELITKYSRSKEDIKKVIQWSQSQNFWVTRLSSPEKIKKNFSEAWAECSLSKKISHEDRIEENRRFSIKNLKRLEENTHDSFNQPRICLLTKGVEFVHQNSYTLVEYSDINFQETLKEALKKYRFNDIEVAVR